MRWQGLVLLGLLLTARLIKVYLFMLIRLLWRIIRVLRVSSVFRNTSNLLGFIKVSRVNTIGLLLGLHWKLQRQSSSWSILRKLPGVRWERIMVLLLLLLGGMSVTCSKGWQTDPLNTSRWLLGLLPISLELLGSTRIMIIIITVIFEELKIM